jgi:Arc/MetJ-type ribon-helix-helix transcriptional regulator
LPRG